MKKKTSEDGMVILGFDPSKQIERSGGKGRVARGWDEVVVLLLGRTMGLLNEWRFKQGGDEEDTKKCGGLAFFCLWCVVFLRSLHGEGGIVNYW